MIDFEIQFNSSFYKKLNPQAVKQAESNTIAKATLEAENRCKKKSPGPGNQLPNTTYKASGDLRRGHSSEISPEEGLVKNKQNYWIYVVFGTSKMPARNYPREVVNVLSTEKFMSKAFKAELKGQGVIE